MRTLLLLLLLLLVPPTVQAHATSSPSSLLNGAAWHDTRGRQIEAHGGGIMKIGALYHWFGSTKKEHSYRGKTCVFECSLGINLYTSTDLLAWDFVGLVFNHTQIELPSAGVPGGNPPVHPFRIERPKVIYNVHTKLYVLVFHCEDAPYRVGLRGCVLLPPSPPTPHPFRPVATSLLRPWRLRDDHLRSCDRAILSSRARTGWPPPRHLGGPSHGRTLRTLTACSRWT
jgi:hypothetical protein|eukprot:COSAG01_NODE_2997_length_6741_cov_8.936917_10_plen_228_part_00